MTINSSFVAFTGFFKYNSQLVESQNWKETFKPCDFYTNHNKYLEQKYYSNWLLSMFPNQNTGTYFYALKDTTTIATENGFVIKEVHVLLFPNSMGVVVIKCKNNAQNQSWENLINFINSNRQTQNYTKASENGVARLIDSILINNFITKASDWKHFNAQLKVITSVDVTNFTDSKALDSYLFALGNHVYPNDVEGLFSPSHSYFNDMVERHSISVYDNWKTLCLYDSLSRISDNLDEKDHYKLWENEYIYIYINVLVIRLFLQNMNDELVDLSKNSKRLVRTRNLFFELINQYNHSKISYKFLPNLLFSEFKKAMEIPNEINAVEKKIERLNSVLQEKSNKKIQTILGLITLFSIFSFAGDGGMWLGANDKWSPSFIISSVIFLITIVTISIIFFKKNKS